MPLDLSTNNVINSRRQIIPANISQKEVLLKEISSSEIVNNVYEIAVTDNTHITYIVPTTSRPITIKIKHQIANTVCEAHFVSSQTTQTHSIEMYRPGDISAYKTQSWNQSTTNSISVKCIVGQSVAYMTHQPHNIVS